MQLSSKEKNNDMCRAGCCMVSHVMDYYPAIKLENTQQEITVESKEVRVGLGGDKEVLTDSDRVNQRLPRDG